MGAVTDDEVIRKRLLIDGDGAGDDRRINLLVKSFIKWCNSGSQEEGYSQYQRMLSTLSQCEFSMGKTLLVYDMNLREMENYEKIYKDIENSIAAAHEKISECKKQILQAKRIRKNRQGDLRRTKALLTARQELNRLTPSTEGHASVFLQLLREGNVLAYTETVVPVTQQTTRMYLKPMLMNHAQKSNCAAMQRYLKIVFSGLILYESLALEYDALAKVIQHHPDRHETLKQLEALGKELQHLSHIKENVEDKLELRRKQFHVLLSTIHELQQTLENDEKLSEAEESQETQMETETKQ